MPVTPFTRAHIRKPSAVGAVSVNGRAYSHGDPIYNAAGQFVGNYIDGMTESDVAALLAYQPQSSASFGQGASVATPATSAPAPAPAPAVSGSRASTNPALRDWIAANVHQPPVIYQKLIVEMGMAISDIDDVMAYPEGKSYGIAYINKYFSDNGIDPSRWGQVKQQLIALSSIVASNPVPFYQYVQQNRVSYAEVAAALGWDKTRTDAVLLAGARALAASSGGSSAPAPASGGGGSWGGTVMQPGGSSSFNESTGSADLIEGSFGTDWMPIMLGGAALVAGVLLFGGSKGRAPRRSSRRGRK